MFDLGWAELLIVGAVALFVIGPTDIPKIAYQVGKFFRRIKYMQYALSGQFDDFMAKAEAKEEPAEAPKQELDHDPMDEAEADAELMEMMPLPADEELSEIVPLSEEFLGSAIETVRTCFVWYAQNGDLPARSLRASLDPSFVDKYEDMQALKNRQYWVKLDENQVVGISGIMEMDEDEKTTDWVNWFCVHPDFRGKGVGRDLLNYISNVSAERGKKFLKLWTSDSANEADAQFLYEKMGFKITSQEPHEEGDSTVLIYREKML
jgi:Tat protein translocase TatB subunit